MTQITCTKCGNPFIGDGTVFICQRCLISEAENRVSTHGDGSKALMTTDAVAAGVETSKEPTEQGRPDDHGSASRESDGKAASGGVPVSGDAESVVICPHCDGTGGRYDSNWRWRGCGKCMGLGQITASVVIGELSHDQGGGDD